MIQMKGNISKNNLQQFEFQISPPLTVINSQNGSGKTSLLKCICGVTKYEGWIKDRNERIKTKDISFYFSGDDFLEPEMTIQQNYRYYIGTNKVNVDFLRNFKLDCNEKCLVSQLSSGNLQKLRIMLTLARQRKYYILDEPTVYLDKETIDELCTVLKKNTIEGNIIIGTNDNYFSEMMSEYVIDIMENGNAFY